MTKRAVFLFVLVALSCSSRVSVSAIMLDIRKLQKQSSEGPKYELVIYEKNRVLETRIFDKGKAALMQGVTPGWLQNVVIVEEARSGEDSGQSRVQIEYYYHGRVVTEIITEDDGSSFLQGNIPEGIIIGLYDNGNLRNLCVRRGGARNGLALSFYRSGNLKTEAFYSDGYPVGEGKTYYENGVLLAEWKIVNGKEVYHREYFHNGQLREEFYYEGEKKIRKEYDIFGQVVD